MTKKSKIPAAVLKEVNKTLDKWAVKYRAGLTKALKKQAADQKKTSKPDPGAKTNP